ncbi:DUF3071 domain-containing protein, partial [Actinotalea ferrariae]|nr:DUF3071 domain-containing protein [Actinotalea ferrariae]
PTGDAPDAPRRAEGRDDDEAATADVPPPLARRARKGRASVPSWDEIVFGAKPE